MTSFVSSLSYTPVELSFGTSGLRGLVTDMTDLECYINTVGFINFLQKENGYSKGEPIYIAGDLRESTPRILKSVHAAISDSGYKTIYCGLIPTPALAFYALQNDSPCIMVTGSHIPADRNGIKFYKSDGEVLKTDEQAIKASVANVRSTIYQGEAVEASFDTNGMLQESVALPNAVELATEAFKDRYASTFENTALANKKIVVYQHSAVGRDMLVDILQNLGAEVITVGRSEVFVPIDSENVTPEDQAYFKKLAKENTGLFAVVSTDGDSDRPFVIDENGDFHRGDELGALVATWLKADFAAYPISTNDAIDTFMENNKIPFEHTRIGSPYVIVAMQKSGAVDAVGWEVNGGFLLGTEVATSKGVLAPLPTRDAFLPIVVALVAAAQSSSGLSQLFLRLPRRFTSSGLIDDFPNETSKKIVEKFNNDSEQTRQDLSAYFSSHNGFDNIREINTLDGIRIYFSNGDIAHFRPSGNAPQLRIYSVSNSQERADEIVRLCVSEPDGIFRSIETSLAG